MLVQLGASRLAGYGLDLGNSQQQLFGPSSDAVGFLQGDTGQGADVNRERAFVERRQEAVPEGEEQSESRCEQCQSGASYYGLVVQCPVQAVTVMLFQPYGHKSLLGHLGTVLFPAQEVGTEHGGQGKGHDSRGEQGHDEGYPEGNEHPALHAAEKEEWHEADNNDQCGVENRHTYLLGGVEYHIHYWKTLVGR